MRNPNKPLDKDNPLDNALGACRKTFWTLLWFSLGINLCMLALPIYSLQVLDRVISSGSMDTLVMLTFVIVAVFIAFSLLNVARSFALVKVSGWLNTKLAPEFLKKTITHSCVVNNNTGSQVLRDVGQVRAFLTGQTALAFFDLPWSLIFTITIFAIHPIAGLITIGGSAILLIFAFLNEYSSGKILSEANESNVLNMRATEMIARNAEVIEAMGMAEQVTANWKKNDTIAIDTQNRASYRAGIITNASKFVRMVLQIALMGTGAYFVLNHELSVGGIIAISTLSSRALAPFEMAIASWKGFVDGRKSYNRLKEILKLVPARPEGMELPEPKGALSVEGVLYVPPGTQKTIVTNVRFALEPGEIVGVVGPSAAGKSTLAKLIMGVWKPTGGHVRLDGGDVYSWNRKQFGQFVGYLPQDVELFEGTIKQNIARMHPEPNPDAVVKAAKAANVHDLILRLPDGYETNIGPSGSGLSAGQRQRIGLARAFFGNPKLIVLDEPNSNLDQEGELALQQALVYARQHKITTVIIAHRPAVLGTVDKILILKNGTVAAFGTRDEILPKILPQAAQQQPKAVAAQPNKVVPLTPKDNNDNTSATGNV